MTISRETIEKAISFRWKYVLLPLAVLFLSVVLTAYFYPLMPNDLAYHFADSSPDRVAKRDLVIALTLTPQFLLVLLAIAVVWGAALISSRFRQMESLPVRTLLSLMGNMFVLPQLILSFAMLDIFSYNAYRVHLMSPWLFALLVMVLGGVVIVVSFVLAIRQVRSHPIIKEQ